MSIKFRSIVACAAVSIAWLSPSLAQQGDYPVRPIEAVVPFPAGGTFDVAFRAIQPAMSAELGVPIAVANRTGAGGVIGTDAVAKSAPDGYVLAATASSTVALVQMTMRDVVKYGVNDLVPIGNYATDVSAIVVATSAPWNTLDDLLAYAKAHPGKLNAGTPGEGSVGSVVLDAIRKRGGIDVTAVPFRGSPPANVATVGGEVDFSVIALGSASSFLSANKLRLLAVTGTDRVRSYADVPTLSELGIPSDTLVFKMGLYAPAGTPPVVIQKLASAMASALENPKVEDSLRSIGLEVQFEDSKAAAVHLSKAHSEAMSLGK